MQSLVEQLRTEALADVFGIPLFASQWEVRRDFLMAKLSPDPTRASVLGLGDSLSEAFKLCGAQDRSQRGVVGAGAVWEALVVWYLNLCLLGTHAVCIRGVRLSPRPVADALSVVCDNAVLSTEPDVLLISSKRLSDIPSQTTRELALREADRVLEADFGSTGVIDFQCKTNWNDTAQVPMLWNMLYSYTYSGKLTADALLIGWKGHSLRNLGWFGYGFVTVPTQRKGPRGFKPGHLEVLRVKTMSAGNYWGYPTMERVALNLKECFGVFGKRPDVFPNVADVGCAAASALSDGEGRYKGDSLFAFRVR